MQVIETLLNKRWILKSKEKELYYQVKDEIGTVKKFLTEKLGYQVIVNPYLIKVEKLPAVPEQWMGIQEFKEKLDYIFFCLVLMFLEEADEQFVLSSLTEYIQSQWKEEEIDWTIYQNRRSLIRVLKYCVQQGVLNVNDGEEDEFASDSTTEVLYENTGVSRYFMKNFSQDIMEYEKPDDFEQNEWIDVDEDRGIVRRQRVYRRLVMTPGMYKKEDTEEDFAYLRQFHHFIQGDLEELFDCDLQIHRTSAFMILGEECRLGRCFPEENTMSDIVLFTNDLLLEELKKENMDIPADEMIHMAKERFEYVIEQCKEKYGNGFVKKYREMTLLEFSKEVMSYLKEIEWIEEIQGEIYIKPIMGKIIGNYPIDFVSDKDES